MNHKAFPAPSTPRTADELIQRARELMQQQQSDTAWQCLQDSLAIKKTAAAYRGLGNILHLKQQPQQAIPYFERALQEDAQDHASRAMLAEAYAALKNWPEALRHSCMAIAANPEEIRYKERFIAISQNATLAHFDDIIENALVECLGTPNLDCAAGQGLWYNLFTLNSAHAPLYQVSRPSTGGLLSRIMKHLGGAAPVQDSADTHFNPAGFDKAKDFAPLLRPFFLRGLEGLVVYSMPFEEFLTRLRKSLLLQPQRFTPREHLQIAAALSHYCLSTEYIFDVTEEEQRALETLGQNAGAVALRGCYTSLHRLEDAGAIAEKFSSVPELAAVIKAQIRDQQDLLKARETIPAVTPIAEGVSHEVRAQYEESPYPKWRSVPRNLTLERVALDLKKPGSKILIAGCGTGQEAAQIATVLPEADILAVDLSLSSLAYARSRTQALGFKNIRFAQADILNLGAIGEQFDGIVSGGVLHHLKEPLQGWEVLTGLLKDGGIMRIALYSKLARRHIIAAQGAIKAKGYPATPEGMRAFRREAARLIGTQALGGIMKASDYYHISMLRDLLFHVQEHCFDIPGLETALKRLKLEFLKFILPQTVTTQYLAAFPNDPEAVSLANWHKFEQDNPDTFIGMYQFWCRKP